MDPFQPEDPFAPPPDPFGAPDTLESVRSPAPGTEQSGVVETDWVLAPADSHLKQFRLVDKTNDPVGEVPSLLFVTFRSRTLKRTGEVKPEVTYQYPSFDHRALRQTFERMMGSSDPGAVLHHDLIAAGNKGSPA